MLSWTEQAVPTQPLDRTNGTSAIIWTGRVPAAAEPGAVEVEAAAEADAAVGPDDAAGTAVGLRVALHAASSSAKAMKPAPRRIPRHRFTGAVDRLMPGLSVRRT